MGFFPLQVLELLLSLDLRASIYLPIRKREQDGEGEKWNGGWVLDVRLLCVARSLQLGRVNSYDTDRLIITYKVALRVDGSHLFSVTSKWLSDVFFQEME